MFVSRMDNEWDLLSISAASGKMQEITKRWAISATYKINGVIPLVIYSSLRSKLRVAVARTGGPLVKGLISFVTEAHDDDGLPHTLEHLTFMGSERYPYKGILDVIANRCLASGTNAYTCQDHTAYQLNTVGSAGFLKVLPVYLDHLLAPMLTDAQFLTEVHHINGNGEDGGVVYSEMQDRESEMGDLVDRTRKQLFYPEHSPYRVDVVGRLTALRTTCTMQKIRHFHHHFYHVNNMVITVCGSIDERELLQLIADTESMSQKGIPHSFECPFQSTMSVKVEPVDKEILCPSDDERLGMVVLSWKGPSDNLGELRRLRVLGHYLCQTAAAPLQRDFVQLKDQLASAVSFYLPEQRIGEMMLIFRGVPRDQIRNIKKKLLERTLNDVLNAHNFDMERMRNTITHLIDGELSLMETTPYASVFHLMVMYQIYGKECDLERRINHINDLQQMMNMSVSAWISLAKKYFTENCVCVMGYPSSEEVKRITQKEAERLEAQRKKLGEDGLRKCGESLNNAINDNTAQKPSPELLSELIVRKLEDFVTFKITTLKATGNRSCDLFKLPFSVQIHSAETNFVELSLIWDTGKLKKEQRIWLVQYFNMIFESPAKIGDEKLNYEEVAKRYTRDLVSYSAQIGIAQRFKRYAMLTVKAPVDRYEELTMWLKVFVTGILFETERVKIIAQKLIGRTASYKRNGCEMCRTLMHTTIYREGSNEHFGGLIQLENFHKNVAKLAEENPKSVIGKLELVRQALLMSPVNLHVICKTDQIMPSLTTHMDWLVNNRCTSGQEFKCTVGESLLRDGFGKKRVVCVGASESSVLFQSIIFPFSWKSEEVLATKLLAQYLSQMEGPMWNAIRGNGLAYHCRITVLPDSHLLTLTIYRAVQLLQAYEEAKKITCGGLEQMDVEMFEAAKRSLIGEIMEQEGTVMRAAWTTILNELQELPSSFWRSFCERIWNASMDEVLAKGAPYLRALFDDAACCRAIAVHPSKLDDILKHFPGTEVFTADELTVTHISGK